MKRNFVTAILSSTALGLLLTGCATTLEMGPGYYHYDTRAVRYSEYQPPAYYSYREPTVVYHNYSE